MGRRGPPAVRKPRWGHRRSIDSNRRLTQLARPNRRAEKSKTVVAINEDLIAAGLSAAQLAGEQFPCLTRDARESNEQRGAKVVCPRSPLSEKERTTFVNQQFAAEISERRVRRRSAATDDLVVTRETRGGSGWGDVSAELRGALENARRPEIPPLNGCSFAATARNALCSMGPPWAGLEFPPKARRLHYKPSAPVPAPEIGQTRVAPHRLPPKRETCPSSLSDQVGACLQADSEDERRSHRPQAGLLLAATMSTFSSTFRRLVQAVIKGLAVIGGHDLSAGGERVRLAERKSFPAWCRAGPVE